MSAVFWVSAMSFDNPVNGHVWGIGPFTDYRLALAEAEKLEPRFDAFVSVMFNDAESVIRGVDRAVADGFESEFRFGPKAFSEKELKSILAEARST